jgi:dihydrofolate reductase
MTRLSLIAAMDNNRLIGSDNSLPWHLPADLAFFKHTTMGKPILMGRKTYESIGKPLPGRHNIVITRNPDFSAEGCSIVNGIEAAIALCPGDDEVMLIGGASLYQQAIEQALQLYITRIHHEFKGDTWFPEFDLREWKEESCEEYAADKRNLYAYSFIKYVREF